jgi:small nuclear ribonucleoprotein (snRNP)-like protein
MVPALHGVPPPVAGGPAFALAVDDTSFPASPGFATDVVRVTLHNSQIIRGIFVAFDQAMNHVLRDDVEIHPQVGRHMPGPLVFPRAVIASLAIDTLLSPSPPSGSVGAPPLALSAHIVPSPPPPSPTDWVVDSGASFHTTTASSLSHSHAPNPSHPPSIVVGNGSTLPVISVGASVLS